MYRNGLSRGNGEISSSNQRALKDTSNRDQELKIVKLDAACSRNAELCTEAKV